MGLVGLVGLVVVGVLVATTWAALRRIHRSRLVAVGTQAVADGLVALTAFRLRPTPHRGAVLRALRISREHRLLRQRITAAQRSGAYVGDVPALLPRLEAEGRRLHAALGRLVGSPAAGHDLLAQADRHLISLADLTEAVGAATAVPAADDGLAREAEEAALGLRLHTAAYTELMALGTAGDAEGIHVQPRARAW
ncbi:MAG: hypothetical protein JF630_16575 [Geodermatophilales bacterium]|nr:hypothetical protein [Geodermatophilales bacterium]